jgi:hypothetical protein
LIFTQLAARLPTFCQDQSAIRALVRDQASTANLYLSMTNAGAITIDKGARGSRVDPMPRAPISAATDFPIAGLRLCAGIVIVGAA